MSTIGRPEKAHKLSGLIGYYEVCNRAEGKSSKTISWHSGNLKHFLGYLRLRHLPDSIEVVDIKLQRQYVLYLLKRNRFDSHPYTPARKELLSAATVHRNVRTLRPFFSWLAAFYITYICLYSILHYTQHLLAI